MGELKIHWLVPMIHPPSLWHQTTTWQAPVMVTMALAPWQDWLAFQPEFIVLKTLAKTIQLSAFPVKIDNQHSPRQHVKPRFSRLTLHITSNRVNSTTLFSSNKSIRNHKCAQFFYGLSSKYTVVMPIQKKIIQHCVALFIYIVHKYHM